MNATAVQTSQLRHAYVDELKKICDGKNDGLISWHHMYEGDYAMTNSGTCVRECYILCLSTFFSSFIECVHDLNGHIFRR